MTTVRGTALTKEKSSSATLGRSLVTFWTVATMIGLAWWMLEADGLFFALGAAASLVVSIPLTRRYRSIVSPWTLVAAITYTSCGARGAAISAGIDTTDRSLSQFLLLQRESEYFLAPTVMYVAATALMAAAFMVRPRAERAPEKPRGGTVLRGPVVGLAIPLALSARAPSCSTSVSPAGWTWPRISAKRTTITGLNLDETYTSHGELLFLNNLSSIAFWIVVAHYVSRGRRISWATKEGWFVALLGLNAIVMPFYTSSRSDALLALLTAAGIALMLRPRVLPIKSLVLGAGAILLLISTMTQLRSAPDQQDLDLDTAITTALADGAVGTLVYNRNLADPSVVGHLYHAVPHSIPYQNGKTITTWALAPVPRSIWPDKPIVNFGPVIGSVIYGNPRSGVPPGWVGDLYLNQGLPAVLLGSILIGWLLGQLDRWRVRQLVYTPAFAVLYIPLTLTFTKNIMSKGIGAAVFNGGIQLALIGLCLLWISALRPRADRGPAAPEVESTSAR